MRWLVVLAALVVTSPASAAKPFSDLDRVARTTRDHHYDLIDTRFDVALDLTKGEVSGTSTLTVAGLARPTTSLVFDAVAMRITQVTGANGAALAYDYDGEELVVHLPKTLSAGERATVTVHYSATPQRGLYFVAADKKRPGVGPQAWTQGEDENTRYWLPSYDYPDDMGTSEGIVTVARGLSVLSNGALVDKTTLPDGRVRWHWKQDQPHVTYLIMLAVADWKVRRETWRGKEVSFWYQPRQAEMIARTFEPTLKMLDFFADRLGVPYPWDKYAQVVVADYMWGGMENTGATVLTEDTLHDARAEPDYPSQDLVAHELAHQWFGDLLTCRGWGHIWLNEGFATYMSALYREHAQGWDDFIGRLFATRGWVHGELKRYQRPIVTFAYDDPGDMFDGHSYGKGAWVLHALRGWIDDDALFWKAIGHYTATHAHQVVETDQLRRSVEEVTGLSLGRFFEQWLYRAGLPKVEVRYRWDRATRTLVLDLRQTQETGRWVPLFRLPLDVRLALKDGTVFSRRFWLDEARRDVVVPLAARPEVVEVDPRAWTPGEVVIHWPRQDALAAMEKGSTVVTRYRAVRALERHVTDETVARAVAKRALTEPRFVGAAAAEVLEASNTPAALEGLLALTGHRASDVRAAALAALASYGADPRAVEAVRKGLEDRSYRVIAAAAEAFARAHGDEDDDDAVERLAKVARIRSPFEDVGASALRGIARIGGRDGLRALVKAGRPGQPRRLREAALAGMGRIGAMDEQLSRTVKTLLIKALDDGEQRVRRGAIAGLEALGDPRAAEALKELARREPIHRVRRQAEAVVARLGKLSNGAGRVGKLQRKVDEAEAQRRSLERRLKTLEERLKALGEAERRRH